jgi:polyisoprenoid-binding protein YceI
MFRKTLMALPLSLALIGLPFTASAAGASYTIDPDHTYPYFAIDHLGFSTTQGRFNKTSGKLTVDHANKTGSVDIRIDANSIDTAHEKRDDHLRSPDFINAAEFPDITYRSTKVTIHDDNTATVEGRLTISGATRPATLNVTRIKCGTHPMNDRELCGFDAHTTIKRSDFGITYALPAIGDEMRIELAVEAYKD